MAAEIHIKRGDILPILEAILSYDDGPVINLTSATVKFKYSPRGGASTSRTMEIVDAAAGQVRYQWVAADTLTAGRYYAEFEITYSTGSPVVTSVLTVPTSGQIPMVVYEDLT